MKTVIFQPSIPLPAEEGPFDTKEGGLYIGLLMYRTTSVCVCVWGGWGCMSGVCVCVFVCGVWGGRYMHYI